MAVISLKGLLMDKGGAPSLTRWRRLLVQQLKDTERLIHAVVDEFALTCSSPYVRLYVWQRTTKPFALSATETRAFRVDLTWRLTALGSQLTGLKEGLHVDLLGEQTDALRQSALMALWVCIEQETPLLATQLQTYDIVRLRLRSESQLLWRCVATLNDIVARSGWVCESQNASLIAQARLIVERLVNAKDVALEV